MFKITSGNRKIKELAQMLNLKNNEVGTADMPCGYTCLMADKCKTFVNRATGKITDGKKQEFRCYGASLEAAFPSLRALHWNNFNTIIRAGNTDNMINEILKGINKNLKIIRIHSFGDFYNNDYFKAWINVATELPYIKFFAYTKVLSYVKADKPDNFSMVYSFGGKMDSELTNEPVAYVVKNANEADKIGVPIACKNHPSDDYNFIQSGISFALMLHGTQPARG